MCTHCTCLLTYLRIYFERRFHKEVEALSEPEWGGVGRGVEVGRRVRVDVLVATAMRTYFDQARTYVRE